MVQTLQEVDDFIEALWLEEGLSDNTLQAYRRDLTQLNHWLAQQEVALPQAQESDLHAYFAAAHASTKATTASDIRGFNPRAREDATVA